MTQRQSWWHQALRSLVVGVAIAASPQIAIAQLRPVPDDTLGNERSQVTPFNPAIDVIDGGARRGANLFHSFREFNVDVGRGVYFTNPAGVTNILTRVTGGNPSQILGVLGVDGTANLFLINPKGILFGPGAQLAGGGSFLASTANSLVFNNGFTFSTTNPQAPPLLTVNVPIGLQYGSSPSGIRLQGSGLGVADGQTLTLAGGDINIDGQGSRVSGLQALGGRVELGGVSAAGTVGLNRDGSLSFPNNVAKSDISITNVARVSVAAGGGGSITINARNLAVTRGGQLIAGISAGLGTPAAQAGDITINATDSVKFDGGGILGPSVASSQVNPRARGNAGGVSITTGSLEVTNGAFLTAGTFGIGNAGSVTINATDFVRFAGRGAASQVEAEAVGNAGGVSITTRSLEVTNGAQISASTNGVGNAGSVTINATNSVRFDGESASRKESGALSLVGDGARGKAGGVSITTGSLEVTNGAFLDAGTFSLGIGDAGSVTINATGAVKFAGVSQDGESSGAFSAVLGIAGNAGGVSITAKSLEVTNRAYLSASTFGVGNAGGVTINVTDSVRFDRGGALSNVVRGAVGNAGGISITTHSLEVLNGTLLSASTAGVGNAGGITINVAGVVRFDGRGQTFGRTLTPSQALSQTFPGAEGNAGGISLTANSLEVMNGALLSTSTFGVGDAGTIQITANTLKANNGGQLTSSTSSQFPAGNIILKVKDTIILSGSNTGIFANTTGGSSGRGGSIIIDLQSVLIQDGATVAVNSQGSGTGGNIFLQADRLELRDRGSITAETISAQGGNITLDVKDLLLLRRNSQISATAGTAQAGGDGGNVTFNGKFIVAVPNENSDISANAFTGSGGRVNITAQGIFGIQFRPQLTPLSDITASSTFGFAGIVSINTPNVDPNRGLVQLPVDLTDASRLIVQSCPTGDSLAKPPNEFIITGRGGLPPTPSEATQRDAIQVDLVTADVGNSLSRSQTPLPLHPSTPLPLTPSPPTSPLIEAQGWRVAADSTVMLAAGSTPYNPAAEFRDRLIRCH